VIVSSPLSFSSFFLFSLLDACFLGNMSLL
jgi:hypothetical protein